MILNINIIVIMIKQRLLRFRFPLILLTACLVVCASSLILSAEDVSAHAEEGMATFEAMFAAARLTPLNINPINGGDRVSIEHAIQQYDKVTAAFPDHPGRYQVDLAVANMLAASAQVDLIRRAGDRLTRAVNEYGIDSQAGRELALCYAAIYAQAKLFHPRDIDVKLAETYASRIGSNRELGVQYIRARKSLSDIYSLTGRSELGLSSAMEAFDNMINDALLNQAMLAGNPGTPPSSVLSRELMNSVVTAMGMTTNPARVRDILLQHPDVLAAYPDIYRVFYNTQGEAFKRDFESFESDLSRLRGIDESLPAAVLDPPRSQINPASSQMLAASHDVIAGNLSSPPPTSVDWIHWPGFLLAVIAALWVARLLIRSQRGVSKRP